MLASARTLRQAITVMKASVLPSRLQCVHTISSTIRAKAAHGRLLSWQPGSAMRLIGRTCTSASVGSTSAIPPAVAQSVPPAVGWWLMGCSASVFGMVVLGGVTRLTRSGLSMTDWRPQGSMPPSTLDEWEAEFSKYKRFPEYQRLHPDMTLDEFKSIFYLEWGHRMAGRAVGIVFGVPLLFFAARGQISRALAPTLGLLFVMGGSQARGARARAGAPARQKRPVKGLVGWWMVKSGLEEPPKNSDGVPRVSPYRLAAHLTTAFAIYSLLLYTALGVLQPRAPAVPAALAAFKSRAHLLALLIGVTAISGAFVAGMQESRRRVSVQEAGHAFNTFPLMEGRFVPEGYFGLEPAYRNFFESVPSVQLHHRVLALSTLTAVTAFWVYAQRVPLPPALRRATDVLLLGAAGQVSLGVATLLNAVPVWLGSAHQAGALTLFSIMLFTLHATRVPSSAVATARMAAARMHKVALAHA